MDKLRYHYGNYNAISAHNVDDIFIDLKRKGIKEVSVNESEMLVIAQYFIHFGDRNALLEGEVSRFMGVEIYKEKEVKEEAPKPSNIIKFNGDTWYA